MTRSNLLYLAIGALVVIAAVLGYQVYRDHHRPSGIHIDLSDNGLSINNK